MIELINLQNTTIETERLFLRSFKLQDLFDFFEYAKVVGVGEMAGWTHHRTLDESKNMLEMFIEDKHILAIVYKESNKVIGSFGIHPLKEVIKEPGVEIGYVISKDYWGQGLAVEATKAVLGHLFKEYKIPLVGVSHFSYNHQSQRVIEKCGFIYHDDIDLLNNKGQQIKGKIHFMTIKDAACLKLI